MTRRRLPSVPRGISPVPDTLLTDMIVAELVRIANATREIVAEERQRYIAARWESTGVPRTAE